jgi:FkbM family methyltransferase
VKYSIIIPTYNHCDDLLKPCVESIFAHTHMDQVQLIICANGCTDNTSYYLQRLKNQFDRLGFANHFLVITHEHAMGFAAACNQGIKLSTGDRVVLLNNDCVLQSQHTHAWLDTLNAPFEQDAQVGITCTLKLHSDVTQREFAPFFCVMIDRKVINQVGVLNENYSVGGAEDMEYCWLTELAGFNIVNVDNPEYVPDANIYVGQFPLYHKAEGTMHDVTLVSDWTGTFERNKHILHQKVNQTHVTSACETVDQVAAKYAWLANKTTEAPALFKEVITTNTYKLQPVHVINRSVIDVGANLGMFSIMCAALGSPQVLACEPVSSTHELLTNNVHQAQLQNQIQCVKAAITGAAQGPIMMGMHADSGKNSLYDVGTHAELVPTQTLDHLVSSCVHSEILLKMDCEGAEYDILLDSEDHVFDRIKVIMMETHGDLHPTHKGIPLLHDRLHILGFTQQSYQPYGIWWYDASGTAVKWEPLNMSIELWSK